MPQKGAITLKLSKEQHGPSDRLAFGTQRGQNVLTTRCDYQPQVQHTSRQPDTSEQDFSCTDTSAIRRMQMLYARCHSVTPVSKRVRSAALGGHVAPARQSLPVTVEAEPYRRNVLTEDYTLAFARRCNISRVEARLHGVCSCVSPYENDPVTSSIDLAWHRKTGTKTQVLYSPASPRELAEICGLIRTAQHCDYIQ